MMANELDEFLAQLDEMSSDSVSVDHQLRIEKSENKKLKSYLVLMRDSTKDILAIYKNERQVTANLQQKLDSTLSDFNILQRQYDELERTNVNKTFNLTELMNEMKENQSLEHLNYIELAQDYFELLSDTTCFYNYEIKKAQGKIISKTEKFLYSSLGEAYKKPKIIRSKRSNAEDEVKSTTSRSSSRVSKRLANKSKVNCDTKRRKTEIWDMKSISQASSPAGAEPFEFEEVSDLSSEINEVESSCSFNTFSIGNETSFSFLQSQKNSPTQPRNASKCKCHLYGDELTLVSIGTNTDQPEEILPSLPFLIDDDIDFHLNDAPETGKKNDDFKRLHKFIKFYFPVPSTTSETTKSCKESNQVEVSSTSDDDSAKENGKKLHHDSRHDFYIQCEISDLLETSEVELDQIQTEVKTVHVSELPEIKTVSEAIIEAPALFQAEPIEPAKEYVEQGTSTEATTSCDKSTATVRSTTTRATSTINVATKSFGVQFPEISIESIFSETIFDLPDCLSPIEDFELPCADELPRIETSSSETITDLCNVNREIDFVSNSTMKFKTERSPIESLLSSRDPEDDSFVILGQTLFDLFLKRIQKSNQALSDDEITRQKIWKHLKRQLLDRFSELTFDETLNASFSDSELFERMSVDDVNNNGRKDGHEEFVEDLHEEVGDSCEEEILETEVVEEELQPKQVEELQPELANDLQPGLEQELQPEMAKELQLGLVQELQPKMCEILLQPEVCEKLQLQEVVPDQIKDATIEEPVCVNTSLEQEKEVVEVMLEIEVVKEILEPEVLVEIPDEIVSTSSIQVPTDSKSELPEVVNINYAEFEEILASMRVICSSPPHIVEPIDDLSDVIWSSLFPDENTDALEIEDCPATASDVLDGFDVEHDPIEIPMDFDDEITELLCLKGQSFREWDTPKSPPPFAMYAGDSLEDPTEIPSESFMSQRRTASNFDSVLEFNPDMRMNLVTWQQRRCITSKLRDKKLCKTRKSIEAYLNAEWTDVNLETCLNAIDKAEDVVLLEAVFETIEDNKWQKDINTEFTPPAPPLPRYQQKLVLLIQKLSEKNPKLPHKLIEDLEEKLFRLENSALELNDLRNISYYYSALMELFFDGDHTTVFYFIVKCIYFFGYKAVPMIFVLVKAFPQALPKKSQLLKKCSKEIDWENMTGLELSKVRLDLEWMDALDMTVMHLVTNAQQFRRKGQDSSAVKDHELFSFIPKFYGFPLSFITGDKLMQILMKRLVDGQLENLTMSLILLARRSSPDFTLKTMVKENLMPMLNKLIAELVKTEESASQVLVEQICVLIESISAATKTFIEEKEKSFKEFFPTILSILSRVKNEMVQEHCIKAILRLQRFIDNQKEIHGIIQHHQENSSMRASDGLRFAIQTFIHRKNKKFCKNSA